MAKKPPLELGSQPKNAMLARLWSLYGMPDTPNPHGYIDEFTRQLKGFSDAELRAATDMLVRDRAKAKQSWPTIGQCLAACEQAHQREKWTASKAAAFAAGSQHKSKSLDEMSPRERRAVHDLSMPLLTAKSTSQSARKQHRPEPAGQAA